MTDRHLVLLGRFSELLLKRVALTKAGSLISCCWKQVPGLEPEEELLFLSEHIGEINMTLPHILHQSKVEVD